MHKNIDHAGWALTPSCEIFARRIFKPLPPKAEAIKLIHTAFQAFSSAFPIFDQSSFLKMVAYSDNDFHDPGWWACVNVMLALAHRFEALRSGNSRAADLEAWGYFQNALSVSTELTMLHSHLTSVQALLGMAVIVQGTPNTSPLTHLLSAAMKIAHDMRLHRREQDPGLSPAELELRKQVFWTAYFLDKDLSLRTGNPPNQDDDEMDVDLPFQDRRETWYGATEGVDFFHHRIRLACIQGQVYNRLCSIKASRQSISQRAYAVREIESILHTWKATVPIEFDDEYYQPTLDAPYLMPAMHIVNLRLSYFTTLNTIHRYIETVHEIQSDPNLKHVLPPPITCVVEARKAIQLLHITPRGDHACIW
jgi:hypothetical protein